MQRPPHPSEPRATSAVLGSQALTFAASPSYGRPQPLGGGVLVAGRFRLAREIWSRGGGGVVYESFDTANDDRKVAIKLLHAHLVGNALAERRFKLEASTAMKVAHPNVVATYEIGRRRDGQWFIVQEFLEGPSLRAYLDERRSLPLDESLQILLPIIEALAEVHRLRFAHRDVKPRNIVLARGPTGEIVPKLVDFGVARNLSPDQLETEVGKMVGTPAYASPEQLRGSLSVDGKTDVWGIGIVLFEMLCGRRPFTASDSELEHQILNERASRLIDVWPGAPPDLSQLVAKTLSKAPVDRPTMRELSDALRRVPLDVAPLAVMLPETAPTIDISSSESDATSSSYGLRRARLEAGASGASVSVGWDPEGAWPDPDPDAHELLAERALRLNELRECLTLSERARNAGRDRGLDGRMRLLQSIANYWLGDLEQAARCALQARGELIQGSRAWYSALGHIALASSALGHKNNLVSLREELSPLSEDRAASSEAVVAMCRLAVALVRAGDPSRALEILGSNAIKTEGIASRPRAAAWIEVARSECELHEGDTASYLRRVQRATALFTVESDIRNMCRQKANEGNAWMQLGAMLTAEYVLRESLRLASPLHLSFVPAAEANLGYVLSCQGQYDEAIGLLRSAAERSVLQRNLRIESVANCYLARLHLQRGEPGEAVTWAERASSRAGAFPSVRLLALSTLAEAALAGGDAPAALALATEAAELLEEMGGAEEGEALARLVLARALDGSGRRADARSTIARAADRIRARAAKIAEPRIRERFTRGVPENAKTLELEAQLRGEVNR